MSLFDFARAELTSKNDFSFSHLIPENLVPNYASTCTQYTHSFSVVQYLELKTLFTKLKTIKNNSDGQDLGDGKQVWKELQSGCSFISLDKW